MKEKLTIVNAFVHDVATGTWISTLVLMTLLHREGREPAWAQASALLESLEHKLLALTWTSLAIILATGLVRALTFRLFGWTGDVAKERVQMLKVKHAILGVAFALGTMYQVALVYGR
jgi:hypothetical protein